MARAVRIATWLAALAAVAGIDNAVAAPRGPATAPAEGGLLLDVPYLPQTEDLCGGAAVAMVLRYWGAREVHPDDFAALVDRSRAGIPSDVLTAEVRRRGWQALPAQSDGSGVAWMRGHIDEGRPILALIAVGPSRYHYVVAVAVTDDRVVVHDPARAPFQVLTRDGFDAAWAAARRWAVVVLPEVGAAVSPPPAAEVEATASNALEPGTGPAACSGLVDEMVAAARGGDLEAASSGLQTATALCPSTPAAWRELAGVRFLQSRWGDAAALAAHATALDPDDSSGWDLLATSQFLEGRPAEALRSWNRVGRPSVDVVRIGGTRRTRHPVVAGVVDLQARTTLTPERLGRAARRLDELPSATATALRYEPTGDGLAIVEAVVVERPVVPRGAVPLAALAARATLQREIRFDVASPSGSGERWSAGWRWWAHRPRVTFALTTPAPGRLPGIATVEGLWEQASYRLTDGPAAPVTVQPRRRRASLGLADWASGRMRWRVGAAFDRWDAAAFASLEGGLDLRLADDRVAVGSELAAWAPIGGGRRFGRAALWFAVRSTSAPGRAATRLAGGLVHTGTGAPLDLWSGAGLGRARPPLLRAHPLLTDGVVTGPAFGRRLAHLSLEHERPLATRLGGQLGIAAFVDAARAWHRVTSGVAWQVDAGVGARLALPARAGTLRLDLAHGLRDGRQVLSAGWQTSWLER